MEINIILFKSSKLTCSNGWQLIVCVYIPLQSRYHSFLSFVSIYLYSLGITCSNSMLRPISIVRVWSHSNMLFVQLLIDRTSIHLNEGFSFFIFKSFDIFLYKFCFIKVREKVGKARGRFVSMRMQMIC
jgi:hypothetical protein